MSEHREDSCPDEGAACEDCDEHWGCRDDDGHHFEWCFRLNSELREVEVKR